ncbi:hypothetical protein RHABOEDO_000454 [Candidatus Rhabdochlamydia oedothoracis]|uniref:Uncharacterized protein n=1 Tax=Candidatus Rhabdochlamydia oedothoracis TaxID=2720720 RepID=A0ABX8V1F3_9BACT|nr:MULTISPECIES: hypothetical protein [Rhabdochlamydia]KAG6558872.1 hypothetical protein RHOW815_001132 [Candidatus Rhabdochlamydia sp. W815]MCL6756311.1 hypothetical protein [Candidatus Rhabdochlamydia oedothoracis]QYF48322.1 hypothetical protein RHABOEDO_000454 [Candidatus Rhabdochlamydia oedothoracis]
MYLWVFLIILGSLSGGMFGFHHFEKMVWIDAYENAAMLLLGMGPLATIETKGGKIFAGTYALFSGTVFLLVITIIFALVVHRFFHKFHIGEEKLGK